MGRAALVGDAGRVVDVAVVGAGPAGSALAARLAQVGLEVALLERTRFEQPRVGETLLASVEEELRTLGCWDGFLTTDPLRSSGVSSVWGAEPPAGTPPPPPTGGGWHVDRRAVDAMLAEHAAACGAALRTGTRVHGYRRETASWSVELFAGASIRARLLVDATGRGAAVGRALGAQRLALDRLVAVAATVPATRSDDTSYLAVETSPEGWWYSAPLPSGETVVMLMSDVDLCRRLELAAPSTWLRRLSATRLTAARLVGADVSVPLRVHPAAGQRLVRRASRDPLGNLLEGGALPWVAVGDAALAVDPVSGSGFVRALRTAATASSAIERHLQAAAGSPLDAYERARDAECTVYLEQRARYYALERRWQTPFWQRRHESADAVHPEPGAPFSPTPGRYRTPAAGSSRVVTGGRAVPER